MEKKERGVNMKAIEAKRKLEERYDKQNDYNRKKYDRVSVMLPAGYRETVRAKANEQGKSLNSFILEAIKEKMEILSNTVDNIN